MEPQQPPPRLSRRQRLLPGIVAFLLVADIAGAIAMAAYQSRGTDSRAESTQGRPHARALPGPATSPPTAAGTQQRAAGRGGKRSREAAVRALLAQRAQAVLECDRRAFLATVASGDTRLRADQRRLFRNLSRLPLTAWRYQIVAGESGSAPGSLRASVNAWTPRLVVRYRLGRFDSRVVSTSRYLTFVHGPAGWRISGVADGTTRGIWDLGDLRVVRAQRTLVVGVGTPRRRLQAIADRVSRAIPLISRVWGTDWSRRAVVLVPATQRQVNVLAPDAGSLDQITAIATVASGPGGVPPAGTGDRIIVNPANFSQLSSLGRRVVLRHELTHVATRAVTDATVPMWLIEGFADYIGYHGVDLPARAIAREMGAAVRSGRAPRELPARADFNGAAEHLTRAYEGAWLACELIAGRHGQDRLVRLYRAMGSDRQAPDRQVRRQAMRSLLGATPDEFTAAWRRYVRVELG